MRGVHINKLRSVLKEKNIKQPKGCSKKDLIKLLIENKVSEDLFKEKQIKKDKIYSLKYLFVPDYEIIEIDKKFIKKFKTHKKTYKIKEIKPLRPEKYHNILRDLFRKAIGKIEGKVDIVTHNPHLSQPFHPKMMSTKEAFATYLDVLADKIEYKELDIKDCTFVFNVIEMPTGGRHKALKLLKDDDIVNKKSICQIKNDDNICLARSIVTALAIKNPELLCKKLNNKTLTKNDITYIKKGRVLQKTLAEKLHEMCDIPLEVCNLEHVKQFEEFLDIQTTIFCRENFNERLYCGTYKDTCIYIYKNRNHFDVITSITGFLGKNNYCNYCQVSYKRKDEHKCSLKCDRCFTKKSNCKGNDKTCKKCNRNFKGKSCFQNHLNTVCETLWKCLKCNRNINRKKTRSERPQMWRKNV